MLKLLDRFEADGIEVYVSLKVFIEIELSKSKYLSIYLSNYRAKGQWREKIITNGNLKSINVNSLKISELLVNCIRHFI